MLNPMVRDEGKASRLFGQAINQNPYAKYLASPDCPNPDEAMMWEHASEWRAGWVVVTDAEVARAKMQWFLSIYQKTTHI